MDWKRSIVFVGTVVIFTAGTSAEANHQPLVLREMFRSAVDGIAVRYPSGWSLTPGVRTVVTDPALCFALVPGENPGVDVKVAEYLPPLLKAGHLDAYQPRPRHFALTTLKRSDVDWTTGRVLSFRDHGRVFYVGVVLPVRAPASVRRTVEAILDSLQINPSGHCHPV